jgi:hypothetical protein
MLFPLLFLLLRGAVPAGAGELPRYVNNLSFPAEQAMEKIASRKPKEIHSEAEWVDWARARLAWVALRRLQGRERDALRVFAGCGSYCEKYGPEKEWEAEKRWGCPKKREAVPCLSSTKTNKTKAQNPPH